MPQHKSSTEKEQDVLKSLFEIIHNRRSIRNFSDKPVPNAVLEHILKAGTRAPFAAQLCSLVFTRDPAKKKKLRRVGVYPSTQVLLIFFVDLLRLEQMMSHRNHTYDYDDGMSLWLGLQDVSLFAENVILAAEAFGLGSVLLGGVPLHADLISQVFNIPQRVFPVVGLCLGYPDPSVETAIRPRFSLECSVFEDSYNRLSEAQMQACMKEMDEGYIAQGYYIKLRAKIPLKRGADEIDYDRYSWSEHISRKFCQGRWSEESLFQILQRHGFKFE